MKSFLLASFIFFSILSATSLFGQSSDTIYVPAVDENGEYYINSLIDYISADTNASGEQMHKVYKLQRGKFYLIDKPLELKNPVELFAEPPLLYDPGNEPAKILSDAAQNGDAKTQNLIITGADIIIKNIWLAGTPVSGGTKQGWGLGQALSVQDSFVAVTLNNIWVDYNGWSVFESGKPHTKWFVDGLHIRNEQNPGDQWTPFLFYLANSEILDTFIVKNCTYFQSNGFFIYPPSVVQYFEIDHCTFVNTLKWPFNSRDWLNAKITNSIFYNVGSLGVTQLQLHGPDPETLPYGIIEADTLLINTWNIPVPHGPYDIPEEERIFIVKNNCYYRSEEVENYLASHDTIVRTPWMNSRTKGMFDDDETWHGFIEENNWNLDPQFAGFPGLDEANDKLVHACTDIWAGNTHQWDWDIDMEADPIMYRVNHSYPLPEYFKPYSGLEGTDGLPIGDLKYHNYDPPTGIEKNEDNLPDNFILEQNYPNPFNPETNIRFGLSYKSHIMIEIYSILGEKIRTLVHNIMEAGFHEVKFDGSNITSGIYIYRIKASAATGESCIKSGKMMLLK